MELLSYGVRSRMVENFPPPEGIYKSVDNFTPSRTGTFTSMSGMVVCVGADSCFIHSCPHAGSIPQIAAKITKTGTAIPHRVSRLRVTGGHGDELFARFLGFFAMARLPQLREVRRPQQR